MVDLATALPELPLFPLPAVLLPGALMPLHIFEPRYRVMIRHALDTHRALAIVLITDPAGADEHGHPPIAEVAGAGIIVDHVELPSGRYNVLVKGVARVRLDELPFVDEATGKPKTPYRRARATVVEGKKDVSPADISTMLSAASAFAARVRERDPELELSLPKDAPAHALADLCAHQLVLDVRERQAILEMLDARDRVRRVAEVLALQHLALSSDPRDVN